jgi:hypothetical protein
LVRKFDIGWEIQTAETQNYVGVDFFREYIRNHEYTVINSKPKLQNPKQIQMSKSKAVIIGFGFGILGLFCSIWIWDFGFEFGNNCAKIALIRGFIKNKIQQFSANSAYSAVNVGGRGSPNPYVSLSPSTYHL